MKGRATQVMIKIYLVNQRVFLIVEFVYQMSMWIVGENISNEFKCEKLTFDLKNRNGDDINVLYHVLKLLVIL